MLCETFFYQRFYDFSLPSVQDDFSKTRWRSSELKLIEVWNNILFDRMHAFLYHCLHCLQSLHKPLKILFRDVEMG